MKEEDIINKVNNDNYEEYIQVPLNDRILLLPHCLRNPDKCKSIFDENGFHCQKCGACVISEIVNKAEENGIRFYIVLRSSQSDKICKRVNPRAILIVACRYKLKKALKAMVISPYNVPKQVIPLNKVGCNDPLFHHQNRENKRIGMAEVDVNMVITKLLETQEKDYLEDGKNLFHIKKSTYPFY